MLANALVMLASYIYFKISLINTHRVKLYLLITVYVLVLIMHGIIPHVWADLGGLARDYI